MDDSQIVELYLSRDESAISQTSQKYGSKLRQIAKNVLSDSETSEECENDAYLQTWNLIPPNEPRTYLFAFVGKILEDGLLKATSYTDGKPSENGQQNFDRSSETKFFVLSEDAIVVLTDPNEGIWRIFLKQ